METVESERVLPFQLQFDKPAPSQIKLAEWNPEKDLLAMVTEDSKIILHRFNWQRLWTISPGKCITSLCWRPDGKAVAVGLEDGTISLHDVENGKLLRSVKSHTAAVVCLNWEEDNGLGQDNEDNTVSYEDRTLRFFPPAPRVPRMPGVVSGDSTLIDNTEDLFQDLLNASHQRFNILCSADKDGSVCFSIFGIFSIGKINIHNLSLPVLGNQVAYQILHASIYKVALSKDFCRLIIFCSGEISCSSSDFNHGPMSGNKTEGMHCLVLDTSIFRKRKQELHQIAQQASSIEDLTEVIQASLSIMYKQWCDAMQIFHDKFHSLSTLIVDHGLDSSPQEEFLSLLGGARTSPPVHQFLVNSLGESGLKRVMKAVSNAGNELQLILLDHIQPAAEIIGFRMGELRGLSRWRARYGAIGLDEKLIDNATEKVGMLLVQVVRFVQILSSVSQQFINFFSWLSRCIKILMSESSDQLPAYNSELVIMFLKFLYDRDPVKLLVDQSMVDHYVQLDSDTTQRVEELVKLGGFADTECLHRTLAKEFQYMESSFKEAFNMPYITVSKEIICEQMLPLYSFQSSPPSTHSSVPTSISFYWDAAPEFSACETSQENLVDYITFQIPEWSSSDVSNCICILRGVMNVADNIRNKYTTVEALLLSVSKEFSCMDLSLYKERQLVLLLNETTAASDSSGNAQLMMVPTNDLPFVSISRSTNLNFWNLDKLQDLILPLQMESAKVRSIPHNVVPPLAISSSRGVGCVFAARKRALVYILDEDEEEESASDMD
ncbi:anaphase-promoting complex subunit 4-like isoform X1 [Chenopodium quinoa]|uniref:anaphase-promoting complex subunit 4-like isoform X1 n=2 Tax=Chenopodium quinoa TaxID=63459 RepID=UPI000B77F89D|nr:anaphase-promoting complex subunit 4-like isoform X1 [Chenopodium quinoa]XP_021740449.1 anaphase-promoting complex subunit 4-like isoform X1 [Chenopodium quinoa]